MSATGPGLPGTSHLPSATVGHPSQNQNPFAAFFGPIDVNDGMGVRADDKFSHEFYTLPRAYQGRNMWLEDILEFLILKRDDWYTRVVAPWKNTNEINVAWNVWHFDRTMADITPEMGNVRFVTSRTEQHTEKLIRRGLGFQLEHGFWTTPMGKQQYLYNLKQITEAVHETVYYGVIHAFLSGQNYQKEHSRQYGRPLSRATELMQLERDRWGMINKTERGFYVLDANLKDMFRAQGIDVDTWIVPSKMKVFATMVPESETDYSKSGPNTLDSMSKGPAKMSTFRGSQVFETRAFDVDFAAEPVDLLVRTRQIGEMYRMLPHYSPGPDYRSDHRSIFIFNMDTDRFEKVTLNQALRNCMRFDPYSGAPRPEHSDPSASSFGSGGLEDPFSQALTAAVGGILLGNLSCCDDFIQFLQAQKEGGIGGPARNAARWKKVYEDAAGAAGGWKKDDGENVDLGEEYGDDEDMGDDMMLMRNPSFARINALSNEHRVAASSDHIRSNTDPSVGSRLSDIDLALSRGAKANLTSTKTEWKKRSEEFEGFTNVQLVKFIKNTYFDVLPSDSAHRLLSRLNDSLSSGAVSKASLEHMYNDELKSAADANMLQLGSLKSSVGSSSKMNELSSKMDATAGDELVGALKAIPFNYGCLKYIIDNDAPFPFGFILARPFMTYKMGSAILCKAGKAAKTLLGHSDFQMAQDVVQKTIVGNYTFYSKTIIHDPRLYTIAEDIFAVGYEGGENLDFYDYETFGDDRTSDNYECSVLSFLVPSSTGSSDAYPLSHPMSITGNFHPTLYQSNLKLRKDKKLHYPGADYYNNLLELSSLSSYAAQDATSEFLSHFRYTNTVCWQGMQYMYNDVAKRFSDKILNTGHWGRNVFAGVRGARTGSAAFIRECGYEKGVTPF